MTIMSNVYAYIQVDVGSPLKGKIGKDEIYELTDRIERNGTYILDDRYPGVSVVTVSSYEVSDEDAEWVSSGSELEDVGKPLGVTNYAAGDILPLLHVLVNTPGIWRSLYVVMEVKTKCKLRWMVKQLFRRRK